MQAVVQFDPFFDSTGPGNAPRNQQPIGGGYLPADQSVVGVMRPSAVGLQGTVIPHATLGGIPVGTNPHETSNVIVNIDPHIPNQSSSVRLGDLNPTNIMAATNAVHDITMLPDDDIVAMRIRGSTTLHTLARGNTQMQQQAPRQQQAPIIPQPMVAQAAAQPVYQPQPMQQPVYQQPPMQQPMQPPQSRSPVTSFFAQPQRQPEQSQAQPTMGQPVASPTIQVTFEMEHFGRLSVNYHDVIIQPGFIVLVYDNRFSGGTKYFPPAAAVENPPRTALNVVGTNEAYLIQTTGVQYTHGVFEYCVLMIEQSWPLTAE